MNNRRKREHFTFIGIITGFVFLIGLFAGIGAEYSSIIPLVGFFIVVSMCLTPVLLNIE